jgi:hypothetical protein
LLGGESLSMVKVLTRLESLCGQKVPISNFFSSPTIKALAVHMDSFLFFRRKTQDLEVFEI